MTIFIEIKAPAPFILYKQNNGIFTLRWPKDSAKDRKCISFSIQQHKQCTFLIKLAKERCAAAKPASLFTEALTLLLWCHDSIWQGLAILLLARWKMYSVKPWIFRHLKKNLYVFFYLSWTHLVRDWKTKLKFWFCYSNVFWGGGVNTFSIFFIERGV